MTDTLVKDHTHTFDEKDALHGIGCPNCGGMVEIPEGQAIVECPFCELRSMVKGERGTRRYQVPLKINRDAGIKAMREFFGSTMAIARDLKRRARLTEDFVVYLPFWAYWARVLGWVFGQKRIKSGKNTRYVPREIKIIEEMNWTGAACDVGEFGVDSIPLKDRPLDPFDTDLLHDLGLVFEPVGSESNAIENAENDFKERVKNLANLTRVNQEFTRYAKSRLGLVYYPLWVGRYVYRGRAFQVVVDGFTGKVLYGKAPGNTLYRAAVLVGGMAAGAFLAVQASALSGLIAIEFEDGDGTGFFIFLGLACVAAGFTLMAKAYQKFRYGEQYEFRGNQKLKRKTKQTVLDNVRRAIEMD